MIKAFMFGLCLCAMALSPHVYASEDIIKEFSINDKNFKIVNNIKNAEIIKTTTNQLKKFHIEEGLQPGVNWEEYLEARRGLILDEWREGRLKVVIVKDGSKIVAGSFYAESNDKVVCHGAWANVEYDNFQHILPVLSTEVLRYLSSAEYFPDHKEVIMGVRPGSKSVPLVEALGFKKADQLKPSDYFHHTPPTRINTGEPMSFDEYLEMYTKPIS